MADTVTTQTIADTSGVKFVAKLTNFSDGTGETLVKKIDASEVTFMTEDANTKISRVWYSINTSNAKSGVEIIWDGDTNSTAMLLGGNGYFDLRTAGNEIPTMQLHLLEMCYYLLKILLSVTTIRLLLNLGNKTV